MCMEEKMYLNDEIAKKKGGNRKKQTEKRYIKKLKRQENMRKGIKQMIKKKEYETKGTNKS